MKNIFYPGAIPASFITETIQQKKESIYIGGHGIFLGQVRADECEGRKVTAIEFTAYAPMALVIMRGIHMAMVARYHLLSLEVFHSLGHIRVGEICLFVIACAPHRKAAIDACQETVERIKAELPLWGKELFADDTHRWKINSLPIFNSHV